MITRTPEDASEERRRLCHAHREIEPLLGRVEALAEMAGNLADPDLERALLALLDAMAIRLLPHFDWEDTALIPEPGPPTGPPTAARLLRQQHAQIRQGIERLAVSQSALHHEPTHRQLADLRARLYALHALLCAHLEQEEDVLLPAFSAAILAGAHASRAGRARRSEARLAGRSPAGV